MIVYRQHFRQVDSVEDLLGSVLQYKDGWFSRTCKTTGAAGSLSARRRKPIVLKAAILKSNENKHKSEKARKAHKTLALFLFF
jgi:hypothetical protein